MHTTIIISDRPITVQYSFMGKEAQETYLTPRERPEMLIEGFEYKGKDVSDLINRYSNSEILENIEHQILEKI